ncbi:MAG: polysaccharide deacetylase family protein [Cetobacterium sp.]|uniref:polysaccharide deacetylase family protein n=1 Tax=Cetobacterium sp. TaxID=2071632 RepID=UPI003F34C4E6
MFKVRKKGDIPILMYHQFVNSKKDGGKIKLFVEKSTLKLHFYILKFFGYKSITFKDLDKIDSENRNKEKYIIITVDDGYRDNYEILYPLLKKFNMKAVIFIVTGVNYNKWTVEMGEKKFDLMTKEMLKEMHKSGHVEFGGHTLTHPSMTSLDDERLYIEISENKRDLEEILEEEVITFAYPYGHNSLRVQKMVEKCGYKYSVSTDTGTGIIDDNKYDIRRTAIDKTSLIDFLRKISPKYLQYKYRKRGNKIYEDYSR